MGEIRAFRGLRFTDEAGEFGGLLSPPSERITPEERERLAAEPNNIVHATMPPSDPDDRSKFVRYARASAQLAGWRRGGLLRRDESPALYRLTSSSGGATLLALVPLASITGGESAPVKERDERLRLLEATRAYFEPITFPIAFENPSDVTTEAVTDLHIGGGTFGFERIEDTDAIRALTRSIADVELRPAGPNPALDAARAFREAKGERADPIAEDYVFAAIGPDAAAVPSGLVLWHLGDFA